MIQKSHFWIYTPKELKAAFQRDICSPTFVAAVSATVKRGKQRVSADRGVDKQKCIQWAVIQPQKGRKF